LWHRLFDAGEADLGSRLLGDGCAILLHGRRVLMRKEFSVVSRGDFRGLMTRVFNVLDFGVTNIGDAAGGVLP
jgi:hypothetical protein